jgi:hypothetical protein
LNDYTSEGSSSSFHIFIAIVVTLMHTDFSFNGDLLHIQNSSCSYQEDQEHYVSHSSIKYKNVNIIKKKNIRAKKTTLCISKKATLTFKENSILNTLCICEHDYYDGNL